MYASYVRRPEDGVWFPETGVKDDCEPSCSWWKLNQDPSGEYPVLIIAERSLSPLLNILTSFNVIISTCSFMIYSQITYQGTGGKFLQMMIATWQAILFPAPAVPFLLSRIQMHQHLSSPDSESAYCVAKIRWRKMHSSVPEGEAEEVF